MGELHPPLSSQLPSSGWPGHLPPRGPDWGTDGAEPFLGGGILKEKAPPLPPPVCKAGTQRDLSRVPAAPPGGLGAAPRRRTAPRSQPPSPSAPWEGRGGVPSQMGFPCATSASPPPPRPRAPAHHGRRPLGPKRHRSLPGGGEVRQTRQRGTRAQPRPRSRYGTEEGPRAGRGIPTEPLPPTP